MYDPNQKSYACKNWFHVDDSLLARDIDHFHDDESSTSPYVANVLRSSQYNLKTLKLYANRDYRIGKLHMAGTMFGFFQETN